METDDPETMVVSKYRNRAVVYDNARLMSQLPQAPMPALDQDPATIVCPYCGATVTTNVKREMGTFGWLMVLLLCCFAGAFCVCVIPFFVDSCKDAIHSCPNCGQQLGRYKKM